MSASTTEAVTAIRRKLWRGLLATRFLCAISFTAAGLTLGSGEGGYYKHAVFIWEESTAAEAAHQQPENVELRVRADSARHYRELSSA